jgi:alkylhydroperoxidase family enzyme
MSDDPRLPRVEPDEAAEEVRPTFDAFLRERGKVPNLYRVAAHAPRIAARLAALQAAVMGPADVPVLLKELLSVRVSHINLCDY